MDAQRVIEAVCGGRYQFVDRREPQGTAYGDMIDFLLGVNRCWWAR
jgi:hypothetical protein